VVSIFVSNIYVAKMR
jgi:hypothetical protein